MPPAGGQEDCPPVAVKAEKSLEVTDVQAPKDEQNEQPVVADNAACTAETVKAAVNEDIATDVVGVVNTMGSCKEQVQCCAMTV
jgi:hypothetical protein